MMWGVSLGEYVIYWVGLAIATVIGIGIGVVSLIRNRGDKS